MRGFDHNSGQYITIDDVQIYFEEVGDSNNPVLLMLHGGMSNIEHFNDLLSRLPEKFRVIGIDNRGQGKSTLGEEELTYELLAQEVKVVLKHLGVKKLSILGFSNGGTIAYRLAAFSDFDIERIITVGSPWHREYIEPIKQVFSMITVEDWINQCPDDYELYRKLNNGSDINKLFSRIKNLSFDESDSGFLGESVSKISANILAIRGQNDPIVSEMHLNALNRLVRKVKTLNIPLAGHKAIIDQPDIFVKLFLDFVYS